jgi:hypothetical protein
MCTILSKHPFIGKNYDSVVEQDDVHKQKGLIKQAAVFPPDRPLEWISAYGSITFSQSGKEMPSAASTKQALS